VGSAIAVPYVAAHSLAPLLGERGRGRGWAGAWQSALVSRRRGAGGGGAAAAPRLPQPAHGEPERALHLLAVPAAAQPAAAHPQRAVSPLLSGPLPPTRLATECSWQVPGGAETGQLREDPRPQRQPGRRLARLYRYYPLVTVRL